MTHGMSATMKDAMSKFKVIQIDDRVEVYKDGKLIGECESYELDAICKWLGVEYEESGEEW